MDTEIGVRKMVVEAVLGTIEKQQGRRSDYRAKKRVRDKSVGQCTGGGYTAKKGKIKSWWSSYRLTPEEVLFRYLDQSARCAICGNTLAWNEVYIDHDHNYPGVIHTKGQSCYGCPKESVRGLVHLKCNVAIAYFFEDTERLRRAIHYLGGGSCHSAA